MRLKRSDLKGISVFKKVVEKDNEGGTCEIFSRVGTVKAVIWPASGRVQAATYGERLNQVVNIELDGHYKVQGGESVPEYILDGGLIIKEGDGVSMSGNEQPEFQIISIKPYGHVRMEAERIVSCKS